MTLGDFTEVGLLVPHLLSTDQASAINVLGHRLQTAGRIQDSLAFFQAVLQRDYLASAATEHGVAFPHARGRGIARLSFALGLSKDGIRWRDNSRVHAVFLIAVPPSDLQLYLTLVAELAKLLRTDNFLNSLMACSEPEQLLAVLNEGNIHTLASGRTGAPNIHQATT